MLQHIAPVVFPPCAESYSIVSDGDHKRSHGRSGQFQYPGGSSAHLNQEIVWVANMQQAVLVPNNDFVVFVQFYRIRKLDGI